MVYYEDAFVYLATVIISYNNVALPFFFIRIFTGEARNIKILKIGDGYIIAATVIKTLCCGATLLDIFGLHGATSHLLFKQTAHC